MSLIIDRERISFLVVSNLTIPLLDYKCFFFFQDTEFPGIVVRPLGEFKTTAEYQYQCLKLNVDFLKIIQLGLTFMDSQGKSPPGVCSYQFNFNFNLT